LGVGSEAGTALTAIPAGLLAAAGIAKLAGAGGDPLRDALAALRLPPWSARPLGAAEAGVAAVCLLRPSAPALAAMAALYAAFAVLSAVRLARGRSAGCGCLWGDERLDPVHVGVDVALAALALAGALAPPPAMAHVVAAQPLLGVPLALALACAVYCLVLVLRHLSDALAAYAPAAEAGR
jgi:hypothetical protein